MTDQVNAPEGIQREEFMIDLQYYLNSMIPTDDRRRITATCNTIQWDDIKPQCALSGMLVLGGGSGNTHPPSLPKEAMESWRSVPSDQQDSFNDFLCLVGHYFRTHVVSKDSFTQQPYEGWQSTFDSAVWTDDSGTLLHSRPYTFTWAPTATATVDLQPLDIKAETNSRRKTNNAEYDRCVCGRC